MKKILLSALKRKESAVICGIAAPKKLKKRLEEMGMTKGVKISCALESPFGGAKAYEIRGTKIAVGKKEGEKILAEMENG